MPFRRCFVCAAAMIAPTGRHLIFADGSRRDFAFACQSCGVLLAEGADPAAARAHLEKALGGPAFESDAQAPYGLDLYTLRGAATRLRLGIRPSTGRIGRRSGTPQPLRRADGPPSPRGGPELPVSLGLICRPQDETAVLATLPAHAAWTDDVAVLLDGEESLPRRWRSRVSRPAGCGSRPAAGGGFRRAAQRPPGARPACWMLQLDADETLPPPRPRGSCRPSPPRRGGGGRFGRPSQREPRRWGARRCLPDVQYRLNQAGVGYAGRVHERPALVGGWPRSMIALHGAIIHHLARAHVLARSRRYEALDPGRGRPEEEARAAAALRGVRRGRHGAPAAAMARCRAPAFSSPRLSGRSGRPAGQRPSAIGPRRAGSVRSGAAHRRGPGPRRPRQGPAPGSPTKARALASSRRRRPGGHRPGPPGRRAEALVAGGGRAR